MRVRAKGLPADSAVRKLAASTFHLVREASLRGALRAVKRLVVPVDRITFQDDADEQPRRRLAMPDYADLRRPR